MWWQVWTCNWSNYWLARAVVVRANFLHRCRRLADRGVGIDQCVVGDIGKGVVPGLERNVRGGAHAQKLPVAKSVPIVPT